TRPDPSSRRCRSSGPRRASRQASATRHKPTRTAAGLSFPCNPRLSGARKLYNNRMLPVLSAPVVCTSGPLQAFDVDLILRPWFDEDTPDSIGGLDAATGGEVARAFGSRELQGKRYDLFLAAITDERWRARRVGLVGAGPRGAADSEVLRRV